MKWIVGICLTFLFSNARAQPDSTYQMLIAKANLLHLQKDYKSAIALYETAFQIQKPDALTAYKAAGMYALGNYDSKALHFLQLAISSGWTEAEWLISDPYFESLRKTNPREWDHINDLALKKTLLLEKRIALPSLRKDIISMTLNDQLLRYKRVQAPNDSLRQIVDQQINQTDLKNLTRAKEIIRKYGWLKKSQVGPDGQNNLWLIVQHADQDLLFQQEALSAMKKHLGTNEINMENYAFLYDRVQCNLNYKQYYGTQVLWTQNGEASAFRPILDEHTVNKRRAELD